MTDWSFTGYPLKMRTSFLCITRFAHRHWRYLFPRDAVGERIKKFLIKNKTKKEYFSLLMAFPKSMSCLVATNMNIFICSGTWRGGCLCWTAWPPQQDAGQDALWEVNELRSFSVGSDISLAWRDLDHLQDFISSQYNMGHYWFLSSSRWSHQQLKLIIHDHQSSGSASPRSRSMTGWRCTGSILFSRRKKIVSLLRWGSEVEKIIEKGKDGGKAFFKRMF